MADTPAGAAERFARLAGLLSASTFLVGVHTDIGKYGKAEALRRGGVMHPWSKKRHQARTVRLGGRYDATRERARIQPTPAGLWAIREKGARPHAIPRTSKSRKAGRTVLHWGADAYAASVEGHARARPAWGDVGQEVHRQAPRLVDEAVIKALRSVFTVGGA